MYRKLEDIAEVKAGFPFRKAIEPVKEGSVFVLQPKNIEPREPIQDTSDLTQIDFSENSKPFLMYGDILIIARGMKAGSFRASVFESNTENVIASSSLHIIRITDMSVLPEYLSIYLNSSDGQNKISELISGSYIGALPRSSLAKLKVPIPLLKVQQSIIDLNKNIQMQDKILERKRELKQNIINSTFKNLINK